MKRFSITKETLHIEVTQTSVIRAHFRGRSALQQPDDVLVPLFTDITVDAVKEGLAVHLHFEALEFFNSATISSVMQCILEMRDKGVTTSISYDGRQKWQKLFFEGLGILRGGDLEVRPI